MSAPYTEIMGKKIVDYDDVVNTILIQPNTTGNIISSWQIKPRRHVQLVALRSAWDAAGNGFINYYLRVNGPKLYPYDALKVSLGSPYEDIYLPKRLDIPQAATIQVVADLGAASVAVNFTSRFILYYFELEETLNRGVK